MKFNFKKVVTAACMAAFLATSFLPGISEAANGRMSLAQAQQQMKRPMYRHYKPAQKHGYKHHYKRLHHRNDMHRPAMHTRGPVSQTWVPVRRSPSHRMKYNKHAYKPYGPVRHMSPTHHEHRDLRR